MKEPIMKLTSELSQVISRLGENSGGIKGFFVWLSIFLLAMVSAISLDDSPIFAGLMPLLVFPQASKEMGVSREKTPILFFSLWCAAALIFVGLLAYSFVRHPASG